MRAKGEVAVGRDEERIEIVTGVLKFPRVQPFPRSPFDVTADT